MLDLVERVRRLVRTDRDAAAAVLAEVDALTAIRLVRAFSTYFHLANVAEQVHRARELQATRAERGSWLAQAVERITSAAVSPGELSADIAHLAVRPVFTAHPTEAARRTVLTKLRQVATLLDERQTAVGETAQRRVERRLEELIELLWQSDELRVAKPDVVDEARNAVYYLDELHRNAVPDTLADARRRARPPRRRPARRCPPAALRQLDRRRPRRQPQRAADDHARRPRAPARARAARRARGHRRAARRPLLLGAHHGRHRSARGLAGRRPRAPARARSALPAAQRRGALPAEAHLRAPEAAQHARAARRRGAATSPGATTSAPPSCSPISPWCATRCCCTAAS